MNHHPLKLLWYWLVSAFIVLALNLAWFALILYVVKLIWK